MKKVNRMFVKTNKIPINFIADSIDSIKRIKTKRAKLADKRVLIYFWTKLNKIDPNNKNLYKVQKYIEEYF